MLKVYYLQKLQKINARENSTLYHVCCLSTLKQESTAVADKPTQHESMPKIAPIRRAYNVVADNTGLSSFISLLLRPKAHMQLPISHKQ